MSKTTKVLIAIKRKDEFHNLVFSQKKDMTEVINELVDKYIDNGGK